MIARAIVVRRESPAGRQAGVPVAATAPTPVHTQPELLSTIELVETNSWDPPTLAAMYNSNNVWHNGDKHSRSTAKFASDNNLPSHFRNTKSIDRSVAFRTKQPHPDHKTAGKKLKQRVHPQYHWSKDVHLCVAIGQIRVKLHPQ
ncbi:hypothetical protein F441_13197 [Phytophthora nicotianae CJ01A1]|uniref:Uncharacterized protein n=2 Tax=Phytophthora nicotianae TaxID=4792 RepID=W2IN75_PHYNI|nr:hypothetical protein L915_12943 [Phytophthora nicotianae]ETL34982.1 hypothetical protein L916_12840 [Phytophthora nicotianae]ETP11265.1 hypothetical protein F441_13197 [Phytophthora nicotianae CJ01A1]